MALWAGALSSIKMIPLPCCWRLRNRSCYQISLVPLCCQIVMDTEQVGVKGFSNTTPHHDTSMSKICRFLYADWCISLISSSGDPSMTIMTFKEKSGLVTEKTLADCLPVHQTCSFNHCKHAWMCHCKSWMLNRMTSMDPCSIKRCGHLSWRWCVCSTHSSLKPIA